MNNNKTLFLILATTFCPLLIAGVLSHDNFSSSLGQKQNGEFLNHEYYLASSHQSQENQAIKESQWQLLIPTHLDEFAKHYDKLSKIKTALGKRASQVVITKLSPDEKLPSQQVYIAAPNGHVLLAYQKELVGKPLYKDLSHLIRSNEK